MGSQLTQWAGLLLALPQRVPEQLSTADAECLCYTIITSTHLVFAFFLPAVAVWIAEQRTRSRFFAARVAASGESLAEFSERLGLQAGEPMQICLFDAFLAWIRCVLMLPIVTAITWLAVLGLSTKWALKGHDELMLGMFLSSGSGAQLPNYKH